MGAHPPWTQRQSHTDADQVWGPCNRNGRPAPGTCGVELEYLSMFGAVADHENYFV